MISCDDVSQCSCFGVKGGGVSLNIDEQICLPRQLHGLRHPVPGTKQDFVGLLERRDALGGEPMPSQTEASVTTRSTQTCGLHSVSAPGYWHTRFFPSQVPSQTVPPPAHLVRAPTGSPWLDTLGCPQ